VLTVCLLGFLGFIVFENALVFHVFQVTLDLKP
jgi:hypothetical protein